MARKKRRFEQLQAAAATPKEKKIYVNRLQQQVGERIEGAGKHFEGRGRTILYGAGALVVVLILVFFFNRYSSNSSAAAQAALGKAITTSQAQVVAEDAPALPTGRTFKSEKERAEAAIAEFQAVVDKYGGDVAEKAKYFIATNKLHVDRAAAIQELEALAGSDSPVGKLAKFSLAQTRVNDNRLDDAVKLYQELAALESSLVAKDTINFEIAEIYRAQGKTAEAADIYFNIAKAASEAKDAEGKPLRMTETANEAKLKLTEIDPERAKQIVEPPPIMPGGGFPINLNP